MTHFEKWSDFADQLFDILKQLLGFSDLETCCEFETFQNISPWQKKLIDDVISDFKTAFWLVNFRSVTGTSQ